jgi:hypothetical protein
LRRREFDSALFSSLATGRALAALWDIEFASRHFQEGITADNVSRLELWSSVPRNKPAVP